MYVSSFHPVSPCFVTSFEQVFCTVTSCFVTNETNETDHQWELLLVCFICFILFQSILEYSLYILIVTSVSVTEKKTCPKKTCVVFVQYMCGIRVHHLGGERNRRGRTRNWIRYPLRTTERVQTSEVIFSQAFRKKEILPPVGRSDLGTCSGHETQGFMPWQAWEPKWVPLRGIGLRSFTLLRTLILPWIHRISPRISLKRSTLTLCDISSSRSIGPYRNA